MNISRRTALKVGSAAAAGAFLNVPNALAADGDVYDAAAMLETPEGWTDYFLGNQASSVTLIEFASTSCSHCANFHANTFPALKEQYIETGKIAFALRPFMLNGRDAAVFALAASVEGDKYYDVIEAFMARQQEWVVTNEPMNVISKIAFELGFTQESFEAALTNRERFNSMQTLTQRFNENFDLRSTPSFYLNGKMLVGARSIEFFQEELDALLPA